MKSMHIRRNSRIGMVSLALASPAHGHLEMIPLGIKAVCALFGA